MKIKGVQIFLVNTRVSYKSNYTRLWNEQQWSVTTYPNEIHGDCS